MAQTLMHVRIGKRLLREPLLHFLVLGGALFLLFDLAGNNGDNAPREIFVSAARIESLAATFARTWLRPPTAEELNGLVDDYIREEVLYREALDLGLDRDDTIIRRRLRQKMEFIADDVAAQEEPSEEQLAGFLRAHAGDYRFDERYTFRQVYLDPERHGDDTGAVAQKILADLQIAGVDTNPRDYGDPFILPHEFRRQTEQEIGIALGESFAAALRRLPPAQWHGPIASAYGLHLVRVDERSAGREAELPEVRDLVRRDWERQQRSEANERFLQHLLAGYAVRIEETRRDVAANERE